MGVAYCVIAPYINVLLDLAVEVSVVFVFCYLCTAIAVMFRVSYLVLTSDEIAKHVLRHSFLHFLFELLCWPVTFRRYEEMRFEEVNKEFRSKIKSTTFIWFRIFFFGHIPASAVAA